jgi:ribosomal protein S27AE
MTESRPPTVQHKGCPTCGHERATVDTETMRLRCAACGYSEDSASAERRPFLPAVVALREISEVPAPVLRRMAEDILRIVNPDVPGVALTSAQLRLRLLLRNMLTTLAEDNERIERAYKPTP